MFENDMFVTGVCIAMFAVIVILRYLQIEREEAKANSVDTCDIVTPLNTYTGVDCSTVVLYDTHLTFSYETGTVEVAADTADIKFN